MDILNRIPQVPPPGSQTLPVEPAARPTPVPNRELDHEPSVVVQISGDGSEQAQRDRELAELHGRLPAAQRREKAARAEARRAREQESRGLSEDEEREVAELEQADREVRAHEAQHIAAGGGLTGTASFLTVQGPDGKSYAIGGHVNIQTSGSASEAELEQVRRAATAVPDMSSADAAAAASASSQLRQAPPPSRQLQAAETYEDIGIASAPPRASRAAEPQELP